MIDPGKTVFPPTSIGLPYNIIIDPRTMKVTALFDGAGPAVDYAVDTLLKKNGG